MTQTSPVTAAQPSLMFLRDPVRTEGGAVRVLHRPDAGTRGNPLVMFTKLVPPRFPRAMVERTALLNRWLHDEPAALTVLHAPSGYGKTVVMVQWRNALIEAGHAVAWLRLDPNEEDEAQFLLALVASLRKAGCDIGDGVLAAYQSDAQLGLTAFLSALVSELWRSRKDIYLFVDDFSRIHGPMVQDTLLRLSDNAPENFRMVMASSSGVELPETIRRSRVNFVDSRALTFSFAEAEAFFNERLGFPLAPEDMRRLFDATHGWIVAMQLAAAAIRSSPDPKVAIGRLAEQSMDIAGYLIEDAMSRLTREQLDFFVRTSFLEQLHPDLCGYVTGLVDAAESLERLAMQATFLQPVESNGQWYRLLPLFAEHLRGKFQLLSATERRRMFASAAEWLGAREHYAEAVEYALQAGMDNEAIDWVTLGVRQLIKEGKVITSLSLIERIPKEHLSKSPRLRTTLALVKSYSYQFREAQCILDELQAELGAHSKSPSREFSYIRARIAAFRDDSEAAVEAMKQFTSGPPPNDPVTATSYCNLISFGHFAEGRYEESRRAQQLALRWDIHDRGHYSSWLGRLTIGLTYAAQGDMQRAATIYQEVLQQAESRVGRRSAPACMAAAGLAETYYQTGRLGELMTVLANRMDVVDLTALPELLIRANLSYARTLMAAGDAEASLDRIRHLYSLGELRDSDRIKAVALAEEVRVQLTWVGEESARAAMAALCSLHAKHQGSTSGTLANIRHLHQLCIVRVAMSQDDLATALANLEPLIAAHEACRGGAAFALLRTIQAIARQQAGRPWVDDLRATWQFAEQHELLRTLVDAGPAVVDLIADARKSGLVRQLAVSENFLDRVVAVAGTTKGGLSAAPRRAPRQEKALLTDAEREIVALVAKGLANKQIANTLDITVGTVKWHLHNIYGKLDAPSRRNVADIARRSGLL